MKALEFANVEHLVLKGSPAIITSNLRTFADPHSTANVTEAERGALGAVVLVLYS